MKTEVNFGSSVRTSNSNEVDEEKLWRAYKENGDPKSREELIIKYAPLVKYVASRVSANMPSNVEVDDLISYGIFGLIDALKKFDPSRGIKFETYAVSRIRGAIFDELRAQDWIPRLVRQKARKLEKVYSKLEGELGRSAEDSEVAEAMGISIDELYKLLNEVSGTVMLSLDDVLSFNSEDDNISLADTVENISIKNPGVDLEENELKMLLAEAIDKLPEKERMVISLYYYEGLTLKETGMVLNVTESRASQLHTKAILRLRGRLGKMKRYFLQSNLV
ncbi:MAG: RNA polymerase sigma factor WhiG [bacterium]